MHGRPYTKDVRIEVLAPDEIMEESKNESSDPDSYPYSEMQVTLRRYLLEVETLCSQMEQCAYARQPGDPVHSPVVFFDGSLVVSFALTMPSPYRERYIDSAVSLLKTSGAISRTADWLYRYFLRTRYNHYATSPGCFATATGAA